MKELDDVLEAIAEARRAAQQTVSGLLGLLDALAAVERAAQDAVEAAEAEQLRVLARAMSPKVPPMVPDTVPAQWLDGREGA